MPIPSPQTHSLWERTLTFFRQFMATLREHLPADATVTVVGAGDGRFVLPLAAAGYRVIAVDRDPCALHGGEVALPGDSEAHALGLVDRLRLEELHSRVSVVEADFLQDFSANAPCDAVWTSRSWHYSANRHRPLSEFVGRMQHLVRPGGVFGAEFIMPTEQRHHLVEHYTSPERLHRYFLSEWHVLLTLRTGEFAEIPPLCHALGQNHCGRPRERTRRVGLFLASRSHDPLHRF